MAGRNSPTGVTRQRVFIPAFHAEDRTWAGERGVYGVSCLRIIERQVFADIALTYTWFSSGKTFLSQRFFSIIGACFRLK